MPRQDYDHMANDKKIFLILRKQELLLQLVTADILFIKYISSNTIYKIPFIKYPLSYTIYQIPFLKYYLSNTIYQIVFIKYHLSNIIYQIPYIKYHLSNTIYQIPFAVEFFLMNQSMNQSIKCFQNGISAVKNCPFCG